MSTRALMIYSHKYLLKIGIMTLTGLLGQAALAVCPDARVFNVEGKVVGTTSKGKDIYFCKQDFDAPSLTFKPSATELLPGGSQVISRGNTIQNAPLVSSVDLSGFNVNNLAFNTISENFPNVNGAFGSPSLFNFYTKTTNNDECDGSSRGFSDDQYQLMINYLRTNNNVFQISSPPESIAPQLGTDIIKFNKVKLKSTIDPSKELTADIVFYRANNSGGQYFTNRGFGRQTRYCWLGVGTRMVINPNSGNVKYAGDYKLDIGVTIN